MKDNSIYPDRNSPCKDCEQRELGCHSTCEAYRKYVEARETERKKRVAAWQENAYYKERQTRYLHQAFRKRDHSTMYKG